MFAAMLLYVTQGVQKLKKYYWQYKLKETKEAKQRHKRHKSNKTTKTRIKSGLINTQTKTLSLSLFLCLSLALSASTSVLPLGWRSKRGAAPSGVPVHLFLCHLSFHVSFVLTCFSFFSFFCFFTFLLYLFHVHLSCYDCLFSLSVGTPPLLLSPLVEVSFAAVRGATRRLVPFVVTLLATVHSSTQLPL